MIIGAAQIDVKVGDLKENLKKHLEIIKFACENQVDLIVFPEMSLTGYCREEALKLAFIKNDNRLQVLKKIALKKRITIIVGAPILLKDHLYIGSFIIQPNSEIKIYTKQFLHKGEELFFKKSFNYNPILKIKNEIIALAICADIDTENHAVNAAKNKATIYIPSIFFSKKSIEIGHKALQYYAKKYNFNVLMSNYNGEHWNIISGGRSAFWNNKGEKIRELNTLTSGLIIAEKKSDNWTVNSIQL